MVVLFKSYHPLSVLLPKNKFEKVFRKENTFGDGDSTSHRRKKKFFSRGMNKKKDKMNTYTDEFGYRIQETEDVMRVGRLGFCTRCHHTFWQSEEVYKVFRWDFKKKSFRPFGFKHIDCLIALADKTPRTLNPRFEGMYAGLRKRALKVKAKRALAAR